MAITQKYLDSLTYKIIGYAIEVHKHLGSGLLESVYEKCFVKELELNGLRYERQKKVEMDYKGETFGADLRFDVLIEGVKNSETKTVGAFAPVPGAVLLTYM